MANLDVSVTLRLINQHSGPAKAAASDLKAVAADAKALERAGAGRLASDLSRVAAAGDRADASIRRATADVGRLRTAGSPAATLVRDLEAAAAGGGRASDRVRQLGGDVGRLRASGTATASLVRGLEVAAAGGKRASDRVRQLGGDVGRLRTGGTATASPVRGMEATAAGGSRAGDRVRQLGSEADRLRMAGTATGSLARGLDTVTAAATRAAAATGRIPIRMPRVRAGDVDPSTRDRPGGRRAAEPAQRFGRAEAVAAAGGRRAAAVLGPAAVVYGTGRSFVEFADVERRMTRVGVTAEASREEMRAVTLEAQKLAQVTAMPLPKIAGGYEALAAQGRKMAEIRAFMPSVAATAQAAGAEVSDIANAAGAVGEQMQIPARRMQAAFDIMVKAGQEGKFELKDMAHYLPSLAPLAASVGLKGEEGLKRLVATAQIIRNQTGTPEEAASSMSNIFAKMESEETTKRFKKFGVDLRKEMKAARDEGKDLLTVFAAMTDRALKGDLSKIPQLFSDMEFARGMRAILSQRGAVDQMIGTLGTADGSTVQALNRVLDDSQTKIDQLSNSWATFKTRVGEFASPGAVPVLDWLSETLQLANADLDRRRRGETTTVERNARTLFNYVTTGQGVDQPPSELASARAEKVGRERIDVRRAALDAEIAAERARADRETGPLRRGVDPAGRAARLAAIGGNITRLEEQRSGLDAAVTARDDAMLSAAEGQAARRRLAALRMNRDPAPQAPEFGFFPTTNPKRNVSFGPEGAPQLIPPTFGVSTLPETAPIPPARPLALGRSIPFDDALRARGAAGLTPPAEDAAGALRSLAAAARLAVPAGERFGIGGAPLAKDAEAGIPGTAPAGPGAFPLSAAVTAGKIKQDFTIDLTAAAGAMMTGYDAGIRTGGQRAVATAGDVARQISAALSITITPTIAPRVVAPNGAPAGGGASAAPRAARAPAGGSGGTTITTAHFHGVNDPARLHRELAGYADRAARDERDGALHDVA